MKIIYAFLLLFPCVSISAQQKVIQLYDNTAPGSEKWTWEEKENDSNSINTKVVYDVVHPTLTVFPPDAAVAATGTAVIVCPGGGFHILSINSEGFDVAKWLVKKGVTVFVLKYRLAHSLTNNPVKELMAKLGTKEFENEIAPVVPLAIADGREAVAYVRKHAAEYGVATDRIGIIGFSAGGTVAAIAAYGYTPQNRPDFAAPIYGYVPPALSKNIPQDAPPMFIVAASDDQLGLAPQSIDLYNKWIASKHSAEIHIYSKGGHGFGMRKQNIPSDSWIDRYGDWLDVLGLLKPKK
ncbi:MAG: alpha/beta hydrolase [Ferruginibacter sp.]